ncbi:MAG TPA: helix-turn-helix transcriptional regulator [Allosphingosinicella sp.]|nr:helix-turn-helix transcriptional regulator [Allosphingosinicella sp.]
MIAGCIEKMRAQDCSTCDHRNDCAFIVPELLGRLFQPAPQPAGEKPPQSRGGTFLRRLFDEIAGAARREMARKPERPDSFRRRVEAELEPMLASGPIRIEPVARALGCSRQTLYRRLKAEGLTFEQVLDGLRRRQAEKWLRDPALPVKEIAWRLGYSDPAAFSRAFKRWTGKSPQAFRNRPG